LLIYNNIIIYYISADMLSYEVQKYSWQVNIGWEDIKRKRKTFFVPIFIYIALFYNLYEESQVLGECKWHFPCEGFCCLFDKYFIYRLSEMN
jgi:hypothetical protein